ncbi:hypothetical protein TRAPUB_8374 [Trametes pubescens]|uniref:Uncharacterized protein n=1 Tax=Trametes pubescens TaxID=154538 RepID=A0A1M2W5J7_TRAPU|nr:hypothetical protein TRAPUB_8374 [Trametes pubescens]
MAANASSSAIPAAALPFNMSDPEAVLEAYTLLAAAVRSQLPPLQDTFGAYLICTCIGCM